MDISKKQIMNTKKILVAFFSRAGENYAVGYIEKGNTHILAEMIAAKNGWHSFPYRTGTALSGRLYGMYKGGKNRTSQPGSSGREGRCGGRRL